MQTMFSVFSAFIAVLYVRITHGACPGHTAITVNKGVSGFLTSPNHPSNYPPNSECTWVLTAPPGYKIQLTFLAFELEDCAQCSCDAVDLRDGTVSSSALLHHWCGTPLYLPGAAPVLSYGRYLYVKFKSDAATNHKGFKAKYEAIMDPVCPDFKGATPGSGIIHTPNYPQNYPPYQRCLWNLTAPIGYKIKLTFLYFDLSYCSYCGCDNVKLFDGPTRPDSSARLLATYCDRFPSPTFSSGRYLLVNFTSDRSSFRKGFKAQYESVPVEGGCLNSGIINATTSGGLIASADYPDYYPRNTLCAWTLIAPVGYKIKLIYLTDIKIDPYCSPNDCDCEVLELFDGANVRATLLTRHCGDKSDPSSLFSTGRYMHIRFKSDMEDLVKWNGFKAQYEIVPVSGGCNISSVNANTGNISSAGYPNYYPLNTRCIWILTAPVGYRVALKILDLRVKRCFGCGCDPVEVFDGNVPYSWRRLGSFCDSSSSSMVVFSTGRYMCVRFWTDMYTIKPYNGFKARYEYYPGPTDAATTTQLPRTTTQLPRTTTQFPRVTTQFPRVTTQLPRVTTQLPRVTTQLPRVTTQLPRVTTQLPTSSQPASRIGCPSGVQTLSGVSGIITHSSSAGYQPNLECSWLIDVPPPYTIMLTFISLDVRSCVSCSCDYVTVRNGRTPYSSVIGKYCGKRQDIVIAPIGSSLLVTFTSGSAPTGNGFVATYIAKDWRNSLSGNCPQSTDRVHSNQGSIQSFYLKDNYPQDMDCTWVIVNPTPHTIAFKFSFLNLEDHSACSYDYVEVRDGQYSFSNLIGKYCGSTPPALKVSSSRYLWVKFHTDDSGDFKGFILFYKSTSGVNPRPTTMPQPTRQYTTGLAVTESPGPGVSITIIIASGIIGAAFFLFLTCALCWCCVIRPKRTAGGRSAGADPNLAPTFQTQEMRPLARDTGVAPNAPPMQGVFNPGHVGFNPQAPGNQYEKTSMMDGEPYLPAPPPYAACVNPYPYPGMHGDASQFGKSSASGC